ncbi:MAG: SDR family NAD(P)-dependent oxidoreductase [Eubacteriales bacterium]|nr:SDR family NAD(P)-dependent oxidoreductase [Eubacteriales bacterium]
MDIARKTYEVKQTDNKKNAIVTGGSSGIGQAAAIALAKSGYNVYLTYVNREKGALDTLRAIEAAGGEAYIKKMDLRSMDDINAMFEDFSKKFKTIDLLLNNGAIDRTSPFLETKYEDYENIMNANFRGPFFCSQKAAKMMSGSGGGIIINISSVQAEGNWPDYSLYAASKAALTKLTKNMALELAEHGIRVIAIHPGYIDVGGKDSEKAEDLSKTIPLGRMGKAEEVANLIVFCASEFASYITGSIFNVDGGVLLPMASENYF